jgi:hypothetical protein
LPEINLEDEMTKFRVDEYNNLIISLEDGDREEIKEQRSLGRSDFQIFPDLIEHVLVNSDWEFVHPVEIGAMIDDNSFMLSEEADRDDQGNLLKIGWVYWNPGQVYCSEVDSWVSSNLAIGKVNNFRQKFASGYRRI